MKVLGPIAQIRYILHSLVLNSQKRQGFEGNIVLGVDIQGILIEELPVDLQKACETH